MSDRIIYELLRIYQLAGERIGLTPLRDIAGGAFNVTTKSTIKMVETNLSHVRKKVETSNSSNGDHFILVRYNGNGGITYIGLIGPNNYTDPVAMWLQKKEFYLRLIRVLGMKKSYFRIVENAKSIKAINSRQKNNYLQLIYKNEVKKLDDNPPENLLNK